MRIWPKFGEPTVAKGTILTWFSERFLVFSLNPYFVGKSKYMSVTLDFKSDTVTKPTDAMLDAMMSAEVGDDVFGQDPTINALEAKAAGMFGHEAALFCPSGTMTNQIAIKVHTQPGEEVICDRLAHIYNYEGGGIAMNSGCSVRLLHGDKGRFVANDILENINPDDPHHPRTTLVSIENTSNKGGGAIWKQEEVQRIKKVCAENALKLHLDGARLFNALVETGESTQLIGETFDSISICLSKGLGCPVGSLLIGNADFICQAIRVRKVFGGGMRQAGYLAAAGVFALDNHVERLKKDHALAKEIGNLLQSQSWVSEVMNVETNIVVAVLADAGKQKQIIQALTKLGIETVAFGHGKIRIVTHLSLPSNALDYTADAFKRLEI